MDIQKVAIKKIKSAAYNPRKDLKQSDPEYQALKQSILNFGYIDPIVWNKRSGNIIGGHQRFKILKDQGAREIDVIVVDFDTNTEKACNLALNKVSGQWDKEKLDSMLGDLFEQQDILESLGIDDAWLESIFGTAKSQREEYEANKSSLSERFLFPPFSVLDARTGIWQERKKIWQKILRSETGRDGDLIGGMNQLAKKHGITQGGTSVFDPVLCELLIQWFCPPNGTILDPFAGGSVRGMISSFLGRAYTGIDLSPSQVAANRETAQQFSGTTDLNVNEFKLPIWIEDDSRNIDKLTLEEFDFILSCPPYGDLEQYSNNPKDLSTLPFWEFKDAYREVVAKACRKLKKDSFAVFVVGEIRNKSGFYQAFVPDTIHAFTEAGLNYYNEAILITSGATLGLRAGGQFSTSQKLGKSHQNVLVFTKGNPEIKAFETTKQLTQTHENVLVFVKGDPKAATQKLDQSIDNLLPEVPADE
ncbi:MAG: DNA methyltransferase [Thermoguttaceae bacterium]|nr:DNA methyltransferase [Thermoguttaceae bacterium]